MNSEENKNFDRFGTYSDKFNKDIEAEQARQFLQEENKRIEERKIEFFKDLMENFKDLENKIDECKELVEKFRRANLKDLNNENGNKNSDLDN